MVSVGAVFGLAEHHLDRLDATVRTMDQRMAQVKGMRPWKWSSGARGSKPALRRAEPPRSPAMRRLPERTDKMRRTFAAARIGTVAAQGQRADARAPNSATRCDDAAAPSSSDGPAAARPWSPRAPWPQSARWSTSPARRPEGDGPRHPRAVHPMPSRRRGCRSLRPQVRPGQSRVCGGIRASPPGQPVRYTPADNGRCVAGLRIP